MADLYEFLGYLDGEPIYRLLYGNREIILGDEEMFKRIGELHFTPHPPLKKEGDK